MSKFSAVLLRGLFVSLLFWSLVSQAQTWISNVYASTTSTTITLSWTTAVPATTEVRYGLTTSYGTHTIEDRNLVLSHTATVTSLTPGTVYHVKLLNVDAEPLQLISVDYTIPTQQGPIVVSITPAGGTIASGMSEQLSAQVTNASNQAVTWTASAGSVSSGGVFTAPAVTTNQQVTVTATSVADPTQSAVAVFTVTAPIQHSVTLNWQASTSGNITFYTVYRGLAHGGPYALLAGAISGLAYTDTAVQSGTTYYYVVTDTNQQGEESADSGEVTASVPSP